MPRTYVFVLLVFLNAAAALAGLLFPGFYREPIVAVDAMSRAIFHANDLFTLLVAIPAMAIVGWMGRSRDSMRIRLLWLGCVFYTVYNQGFYLFCVELNIFFPLYLSAFAGGAAYLAIELHRLDPQAVAREWSPSRWATKAGAIHAMLFVACLLATWTVQWIDRIGAPVFDPVVGRFVRSVAALDVTLLVPGLLFTGMRLWKGDPRGIVSGVVLNVGICLYMAVLAFACLEQARQGLPSAMDELPLWAMLSGLSLASLVVLLRCRRGQAPERNLSLDPTANA